mmetsp:Transcript_3218/g.7508  ORF Transcript_3218/g.7508 Transcript_3218/m.7508 type:complete len:248 (+) Transcript_3218:306-1049(+)
MGIGRRRDPPPPAEDAAHCRDGARGPEGPPEETLCAGVRVRRRVRAGLRQRGRVVIGRLDPGEAEHVGRGEARRAGQPAAAASVHRTAPGERGPDTRVDPGGCGPFRGRVAEPGCPGDALLRREHHGGRAEDAPGRGPLVRAGARRADRRREGAGVLHEVLRVLRGRRRIAEDDAPYCTGGRGRVGAKLLSRGPRVASRRRRERVRDEVVSEGRRRGGGGRQSQTCVQSERLRLPEARPCHIGQSGQ